MDEIRKLTVKGLPTLPKIRRTPLLEDAVAFAVLGGGGYLALRGMDLLFRALGVG
jgi:hypothetical protein